MSFAPPCCPNVACPQHRHPDPGFFVRRGFYLPQCRLEPVPRFRCRACGRGFSRQTFRHDYRDHRPECNHALFVMLTSGVGLRQAGRNLGLDVRGVQQKMRKMARTCGWLHDNFARRLPSGLWYLMDEEETYEGASIRPLTMPVLIEKETWFVVATAVGSIRRLAPSGTARRRRQDEEERQHGRRPDESSARVWDVLSELARRTEGSIGLRTDQKPSYASIAGSLFGERLRHETTSGSLVRTTHNPLFPINTTLAMTRDNCGRLRRRSWLVSKRARYLRSQLSIFTAYRNYVRRRFNRDRREQTPASLLGLVERNLQPADVLRWRQDWGVLSMHPLSVAGQRRVGSS